MKQGHLVNWLCVVALSTGVAVAEDTPNPRVRLATNLGDVTLELEQAKAPVTVANFLAYVKDGYYVGTAFHRVIPGFMVQGGGLNAKLEEKREGQRPPIKNESENGLKNETGTVAMARTSIPDSATSQFFINVKDNGFLDRAQAQDGVGYAVFGRVVEGMDVVRKIESVKTGTQGAHRDVPMDPVIITAVEIVEAPAEASTTTTIAAPKPD